MITGEIQNVCEMCLILGQKFHTQQISTAKKMVSKNARKERQAKL